MDLCNTQSLSLVHSHHISFFKFQFELVLHINFHQVFYNTNECQLHHIIFNFSSLCFVEMCDLRACDAKNAFSQNGH